ncbi:MAG: SURF1 family protein [Sphingobium sp.]
MTHTGIGRRSPLAAAGITLAALSLLAAFVALGLWQLDRLAWKRDLIARVAARVHASPVAAPMGAGPQDEYRRVVVQGRFLHDRSTLVRAATVHGSGYWVMTPVISGNSRVTIVNRGFVPPERKSDHDRPSGIVQVTGLLRLSEPDGGFLRANDPAGDRWYSRDVAAIARARGLANDTAPYFIDAQSPPGAAATYPIAGLTVLSFSDNHLGYAFTWFALAAMTLAGYAIVMTRTGRTGSATDLP